MHPDHMDATGSCSICGAPDYDEVGICLDCEVARSVIQGAEGYQLDWLFGLVLEAVDFKPWLRVKLYRNGDNFLIHPDNPFWMKPLVSSILPNEYSWFPVGMLNSVERELRRHGVSSTSARLKSVCSIRRTAMAPSCCFLAPG